MRVFLRITWIFFASFTMYSCGNALSDLNWITANEIPCDVNASQAKYYYEKYGQNNSKIGPSDDLKRQAFEKLSNVPEEYLEYVIGQKNIPIQLAAGKYNGGVTYLIFPSENQMAPQSISSELWCLAHEFGHASEGHLWDKFPSTFRTELAEISALIAQKYQNVTSAYLRSYAYQSTHSRDRETFAELFDTWHCSDKARETLRNSMPEVYAFGEKYLGSPSSEEDINVLFTNKGSNPRLYFANNNEYSKISYCISFSNSECKEKLSVSKYTNKKGNDNIFVSSKLNLSGHSSFVVYVYGDDSLVRKVSISKKEELKRKEN